MRPPRGAVSPAQTRVFLAVVELHRRERYASVRTVAREAGYKSTSTVHALLLQLKDRGLVDWEWGKAGTLRPVVHPIRAWPDRHPTALTG